MRVWPPSRSASRCWIELTDRKLLSDHEVQGLLEDAAAAHRNAKGTPQELEAHRVLDFCLMPTPQGVTMSSKSSVPQAANSVSQVMMSDSNGS